MFSQKNRNAPGSVELRTFAIRERRHDAPALVMQLAAPHQRRAMSAV